MSFGRALLEDPYTTDDVTSGAPIMPSLTRGATEVFLRKAVKEGRHNVVFKTGTVSGFRSKGSDLGSVTVKVDGVEEQVEANFVIDATGPSQMSYSKWLRNAGFSLPSDLRVEYDPILRYAASVWTIPSHLHPTWPAPGGFKCGFTYNMSGDAGAGEPRSFGFAIAENNQMVITIGGASVSDLPTSLTQLRAYANDLYGARIIPDWVWQLFDFMEEHEEECRPFWVDSRIPPMSWVQWLKIANKGTLPKNWIAVGDANMTLNPLTAQGIYKTCIDSTTLDAVLRSIPSSSFNLPNIPALFYGRQNPRVSSIWDGGRAVDYGYPTTIPVQGEDLSHNSWIRKYGRACIILAQDDAKLRSVWWHVAMQLSPGTDLFAPWIVLKVARYQLFGW
ncbi:hypothetical protein M407DRAFT_132047 [Tulasnella calospora MUT 4182]|uniref:FAD-binding domain-containing protein n=1 Tax=Tulasnella calospora MUT 4182 TaxID=1051891 RepID=A0A0C3LHT0_9AGAM|nr:hypothetical protein M407DRAFT_132047 [Tulasnella calospora MUT 4182]